MAAPKELPDKSVIAPVWSRAASVRSWSIFCCSVSFLSSMTFWYS